MTDHRKNIFLFSCTVFTWNVFQYLEGFTCATRRC